MKNKNTLGVIILTCAAVIWGMSFAFQISGMEHIGPFTFQATRNFLAVVAIGIVLVISHGKTAFKFSKDTVVGGIVVGLILSIAVNLQQIGLMYTTAGKSGFITALYIVFVPLASFLVLKRKIESKIWVAVIVAAAGLYFLCIKEDFSIGKGDLWTLGCALMYTCHILVTGYFAPKTDGMQLSFIQFIVATVVSGILMFVAETPQWSAIWDAKVAIIYCGVFSGGVGYTLQIFGQKYARPAAASLAMSLESVFAAVGGWIILQEVMSAKELLGAVLMFAAILIVEINFKKEK